MNKIIPHLGSNYLYQKHFLKPTLSAEEINVLYEGLTTHCDSQGFLAEQKLLMALFV